MNTIEKEIDELEVAGVFTLTAKKEYKPLKDFKDMKLEKVYTTVVNLTHQPYATFKHIDRETKGTYCHPISNTKYLWEHNTNPDAKYLRVYKSANTEFFPVKTDYYFNGKKISDKNRLAQIKASYFRKESSGNDEGIFNVSTKNIIELKRGDIRIKKK